MSADLAARVARLPTAMIELLVRWTRADGELDRRGDLIQPRNRALPARLSFAQERLWFLEQLNPGNTAYSLPLLLPFPADCDAGALRTALSELIARHESLRTTFAVVGGLPVQRVAAEPDVALREIDLRDSADPAAGSERSVRDEIAQPFDLARGPLLRCVLVRRDGSALLVANMHHIISDGWSCGVFARELTALYQALVNGTHATLRDLPIQYADFAAWQREWLQGGHLCAQVDYWRTQLADAPPLVELPNDTPRPPVESHRGAYQTLALPPSLAQSLNGLARAEGATLFMVMLAAFAALVSRCAGVDDVVIGSPIANRNRQEQEALIGFFVNMLALRVRAEPSLTLRELVGRVRETTLGGYEHQDLPFEKLVDELRPRRSLAHSPLFQVAFVLQNTPDADRASAALDTTYAGWCAEPAVAPGAAKCDLTLSFGESDAGLSGTCEYRTDLFAARSVHRFLHRYRRVLETLAATPDLAISDLALHLPDEPDAVASPARITGDSPAHALAALLGLGTAARVAVLDIGAGLTNALRAACAVAGATLTSDVAGATHVVGPPEAMTPERVPAGAVAVLAGLPCFDVAWTRLPGRRVVGLWGTPGAPAACALELCAHAATLGATLGDVELDILDAQGRRVPVDLYGELHVATGGRSLATGLVARRRDDGCVDVLGRADALRRCEGQRIDPQQLVALLRQHPAIADAQVHLNDGGGAPVLVAHAVPRGTRRLDEGELIHFVASRLPAGCVPKRITIGAAPPANFGAAAAVREAIVPRTPAEAVLARIWSDVLKRPITDVQANFFDLGGNSLNSVQVIGRVRDVLRVELGLHRLFEAPSIAELALVVEADPQFQTDDAEAAGEPAIGPALQRTFSLLGIDAAALSPDDVLDLVHTLEDWEVDELVDQLQRQAGS